MHRTPYRKSYKHTRRTALDRTCLRQYHLKNITFDSAPRCLPQTYDQFKDTPSPTFCFNPEVSQFSLCKYSEPKKASKSFRKSEMSQGRKSQSRNTKRHADNSQTHKKNTQTTIREPIVHRLIQNSLELVRLSQENLENRKQLLREFEEELQEVWIEFTLSLREADNENKEQVEGALEFLVRQRTFIEGEQARIQQLLQEVKL